MSWDKQKALESVDGDEELLQELVNLFIDTMEGDIALIKQGKDAGDNTVVSSAAHSIKGSSVTLGFESIRALAEKIEQNGKAGNTSTLEEDLGKISEHFQELKKANG